MKSRRISPLIIATIVILIVFVGVLTYISWGTEIGVSIRYYYYLTAIFTLSLVLTVVGIAITEQQRRNQDEKERFLHRLRINQNYWIDLEKVFMKYNPQLNRLYKQMWPNIPEIQSIPDPPNTPEVNMQEIHAANMVLGMMHNINDSVTYGHNPKDVLKIWQKPEYRGFYAALANWMQSDIIYTRWCQSGHLNEMHMEILVRELRKKRFVGGDCSNFETMNENTGNNVSSFPS